MRHEVERGTFSPLAFSTSGGMAPIATASFVYKCIAILISEKKGVIPTVIALLADTMQTVFHFFAQQ